jgi:hypothetical protein
LANRFGSVPVFAARRCRAAVPTSRTRAWEELSLPKPLHTGDVRAARLFSWDVIFASIPVQDHHRGSATTFQPGFQQRSKFYPGTETDLPHALQDEAIHVTLGAISLSSSSHFPLKLNSNIINPVTLPPARAKLATKPAPT